VSALGYQELDFRQTPLGDLMLRRRRAPEIDEDIYEVKLGDAFLMTSLFHEAERQLARRGLAQSDHAELDIVVGGLGLGYTAAAALEDPRVTRVLVVEFLAAVIEWHERGLVPLGPELTADPRCRFLHADFFERVCDRSGFDPDNPARRFDAILLDIDHTPTHLLDQSSAPFYTESGLHGLRHHLKPGGIFAMWADGNPDPAFTQHLGRVFASAEAHTIRFNNPMAFDDRETGGESTGAVYVASTEPAR